jgi:hypothetical protein
MLIDCCTVGETLSDIYIVVRIITLLSVAAGVLAREHPAEQEDKHYAAADA